MPEAPRRRAPRQGEKRRPASQPSREQRDTTAARRTSPARSPQVEKSQTRFQDSAEPPENGADSSRHPPIKQLVASAREQLEEVIGRPVSATLGFERQEDGWQLTVEVVELERIPDTTSILGCYRAHVSENGELTEYRRIRRYSRSQPDEDY